MSRAYKHGNGRIQVRARGGRFRDATLVDVGLDGDVCEGCRAITLRQFGAPPPELCEHCGAVFVRERCAWSRKVEPRHLGPEDLADIRAGAFTPCGAPAVACDVVSHAGRCGGHLDALQEGSR